MEGKQSYSRDLRGEEKPIKKINAVNARLIESARSQLERIGPALRDLAQRIIDEKPDMIVFLDKGARLLASSVSHFLADKVNPMPKISFYNDDGLKGSYLHFQDSLAYPNSLQALVTEDFKPFKGKKVFFVDETFSFGKGAAALSYAIEESGVDGYYFALTHDKEPAEDREEWNKDETHRVSYEEIPVAVQRLKDQGRLKIYDNDIGYLFTKDAAKLYVVDKGRGDTGPRYQDIPDQELEEEYDYSMEPGELPNARTYLVKKYPNRDWKEYDRKVRLSNMATVEELKNLVLQTLETGK